MQNTLELKSRINAATRAAQHLLNEKGAARWTPVDQAKFDRHLDDAERAQEMLDSVLAMSGQQSVIAARQRDAVEIYLRKDIQAMSEAERRLVRNTLSTTTPSQGGYAVPTLVAAEILSLAKDFGSMRQVCSQLPTATGAAMGYPTSDGTSEVGEQLAANATATSADPTFGSAAMTTFKYSSKVFSVPMELLQDAQVDIVEFIAQRAMERIGRIQNLKFTIGVGGTTEPTGLVPAAAVGKVGTTGQTITVIYDDLVDLADTPDVAHGGPGWMMSQTARRMVRKVKDTNGRPIWTPSFVDSGGPAASGPAQLLGYPVQINNDMPVPAANAKSIAFGNFKRYVVRDVLDVSLMRFDDSAYTKLGQVGFLMMARAGGNLVDTGAVTLYQHSAT